jgi:hypothetical protein
MMKITYHISGTADIQPSEISERILPLLNKPGYVILEKNSKTIEFKDNIWRLGSRMQAYGRVDGGTFEINIEGAGVVVNFDYYVSLDLWILFLVFFAFFALTKEVHIFYLIPFFFILFYFKVENVKSTAQKMMKDILNLKKFHHL